VTPEALSWCSRLRLEEAPVSEAYEGKQIVGIDLHRRRSVVVRVTESGERLVLQPHLVMFEVLLLVVACSGVGLVASSPVGPVVGVCSGV
jgi:hypothetical protein